MSVEIKPCPFCGSDILGDDHRFDFDDKNYIAWVDCYSCDARGPEIGWFDDVGEAHTEAIKLWNKREG
ncbi:Lar family restriction alleviation protein [Xenorhabdus budapestensis]|uniref:Lar family restriction alleviation protein n=1 Tax=Xenorhabdus budapestensis TaxID=290110 RepID=UPI003A8A7675